MVSIISGNTAIEIVNTLIKNNYISSHQHAADMGIELCKAELALKYKLNYIQDKDLLINFKNY
jgi:dihydropteroate synthase